MLNVYTYEYDCTYMPIGGLRQSLDNKLIKKINILESLEQISRCYLNVQLATLKLPTGNDKEKKNTKSNFHILMTNQVTSSWVLKSYIKKLESSGWTHVITSMISTYAVFCNILITTKKTITFLALIVLIKDLC